MPATSRLRSSPLQGSAVARPRRPLPLERRTVGLRLLIVFLSVKPLPHVWSKDLRSALALSALPALLLRKQKRTLRLHPRHTETACSARQSCLFGPLLAAPSDFLLHG